MPKGPTRRGGYATLGARLTRCRLQMDWTQHQLAARVRTSQAVIQRIETGRCRHPRILDELAAALEVSPAWLMYGADPIAGLGPEAHELAQVWSTLAEPHRSAFKQMIINGGMRHSSAA